MNQMPITPTDTAIKAKFKWYLGCTFYSLMFYLSQLNEFGWSIYSFINWHMPGSARHGGYKDEQETTLQVHRLQGVWSPEGDDTPGRVRHFRPPPHPPPSSQAWFTKTVVREGVLRYCDRDRYSRHKNKDVLSRCTTIPVWFSNILFLGQPQGVASFRFLLFALGSETPVFPYLKGDVWGAANGHWSLRLQNQTQLHWIPEGRIGHEAPAGRGVRRERPPKRKERTVESTHTMLGVGGGWGVSEKDSAPIMVSFSAKSCSPPCWINSAYLDGTELSV